MNEVREEVRERYAKAATRRCKRRDAANDCLRRRMRLGSRASGWQLYDAAERAELPEDAVLASLGCGNPTAVAELREGETVLDLGSGGGIDVLLSADGSGRPGRAYGLDMTDEMLELARRNAAEAGVDNVEFLKGYIEEIPLPDASVDVIISNCVINLSVDKPRVFAEMARVLRPGGRLGDQRHRRRGRPDARRARRARQLRRMHRRRALVRRVRRRAPARRLRGHRESSPTHEVTDRMFGAIVRARRP